MFQTELLSIILTVFNKDQSQAAGLVSILAHGPFCCTRCYTTLLKLTLFEIPGMLPSPPPPPPPTLTTDDVHLNVRVRGVGRRAGVGARVAVSRPADGEA